MAGAGIETSTPIIVVVGNDVDSVVAVHAALRIDAVVLLVPRSAGETQVADIIARTGADFGVAPNWPGAAPLSETLNWVTLDVEGTPRAEHRAKRPADEPCLVLYT